MCLELAQIVAKLVEAVGVGGEMNVVRTASWISRARPAADLGAGVKSTSMRRMMRVSWILMPGLADRADRDGEGDRLEERKIDVNVERLASKPAKRLVIAPDLGRIAARLSRHFLRPKSLRLLVQSSLRRNIENFSYCLRTALRKQARNT